MTTLEELQQQYQDLSSRIVAERHYATKEKLQQQRAELLRQIQPLELQRIEKIEKDADNTLKSLLSENRNLILLDIVYSTRTERINIPPNLKIKIRYEPCGDEEALDLKELLREYDFIETKRTPKPNSVLFIKWKELSAGPAMLGRRNCPECHKHKKKSIGWANFALRWVH